MAVPTINKMQGQQWVPGNHGFFIRVKKIFQQGLVSGGKLFCPNVQLKDDSFQLNEYLKHVCQLDFEFKQNCKMRFGKSLKV